MPPYVAFIGHADMVAGPATSPVPNDDQIAYTADDLCALLNEWRDFYDELVKAGVLIPTGIHVPDVIPAMCEHGSPMQRGNGDRFCWQCKTWFKAGSRPFNLPKETELSTT